MAGSGVGNAKDDFMASTCVGIAKDDIMAGSCVANARDSWVLGRAFGMDYCILRQKTVLIGKLFSAGRTLLTLCVVCVGF
ncbi:hypothetical protein DPMN_135447 [Dreissena polymorpha]|uniref:Uncharacterized protein n=1 Tax=Dreissena polymorpha TaxID=45954 RepID=A0A9D4FXP4_DREPO|nr:hypothetical protein DPMN_135447 [Dreissena polymorpha]